MTRDAKIVAGWDFDRIIPCHGVRYLPSFAGYLTNHIRIGRYRDWWKISLDGCVQGLPCLELWHYFLYLHIRTIAVYSALMFSPWVIYYSVCFHSPESFENPKRAELLT